MGKEASEVIGRILGFLLTIVLWGALIFLYLVLCMIALPVSGNIPPFPLSTQQHKVSTTDGKKVRKHKAKGHADGDLGVSLWELEMYDAIFDD